MMKKTIAITLALTAILGTTGVFAQSETNTESVTAVSAAAEDYIAKAVSLGIIEKADLSENITREQFCEYAYNMINKVKELPVAKLAQAPFDDVMNYKINALAFSNIISGKDDRTFAPNDTLTREEAAVLLCRLAKYADVDLPLAKVDLSYADNSEISPWAVSDVYSLKILNILESTQNGFKPKENITAKEAVTALVKLHNIIKK